MSRYQSDTLPPSTPVIATLVGHTPLRLTAEGVAANLSRAFDADRVDLLMLRLDTERALSVVRMGQRITFTVA